MISAGADRCRSTARPTAAAGYKATGSLRLGHWQGPGPAEDSAQALLQFKYHRPTRSRVGRGPAAPTIAPSPWL